jgi:CRP/FNR family transcriptional regulator
MGEVMRAPLRIGEIRHSCSRCTLQQLCLPYGLNPEDVQRLEQLVRPSTPIGRNQTQFAQGDSLSAIYAITHGSLKTVLLNEDGFEQIVGFYYPGEVLGLDAVGGGHHRCSAIALEDSHVCRIPFDRLDDLVDHLPSLRRQLMRLMSQALSDDDQLLLTLGRKSSEARLATWLMSLCRRREKRHLPSKQLWLSMNRADIANYLGMRVETVSRILGRLQADDVIRVKRREVDILNFGALLEWASRGAWVADQ